MTSLTIDLAGERVELLPGKAMHWPRRRSLFIADPHWGKAAAFRAGGIALAVDPLSDDLARLFQLLAFTRASRLVILGDLLHARAGKSAEVLRTVQQWRNGTRAEVLLVRGNHDRAAGDPPAEWRFECVAEPYADAPFVLRHFPEPHDTGYTLAGHLHPGATLTGLGRERMRVPCFHFGASVGILPAFGGFTGTAAIAAIEGDRVFAIADGEVIELGTEN